MTPAQPACPALPNPVSLSENGYSLGHIEPIPISPSPVPLQKIVHSHGGLTNPVYLDTFGNSACAYPIQLEALRFSSSSLNRQILSPQDWFRTPLFGTPTSLRVGKEGESHPGSIYDPGSGLFFAQDVRGARWYLIGDPFNYATFSAGIAGFTSRLYDTFWNLNPTFSPWVDIPEPIYSNLSSPPSRTEALEEMEPFLRWLETFDPELRGEASGLEYSETLPEQPGFDCPNPYLDSLYAFYDSPTDRIHLTPVAIEMLRRGEYEAVAEILAHERAHRRSYLAHLVVPSEQMLDHSVTWLMGAVIQQGLVPAALLPRLDHFLRNRAYCEFLPLLPEEEYQAFHHELDYSSEHSLSFHTHPLQEEARELSHDMNDILTDHFPAEWSVLGAQYVQLARRNF